jgi:hypothetical protein
MARFEYFTGGFPVITKKNSQEIENGKEGYSGK